MRIIHERGSADDGETGSAIDFNKRWLWSTYKCERAGKYTNVLYYAIHTATSNDQSLDQHPHERIGSSQATDLHWL